MSVGPCSDLLALNFCLTQLPGKSSISQAIKKETRMKNSSMCTLDMFVLLYIEPLIGHSTTYCEEIKQFVTSKFTDFGKPLKC